MCRGSWKHPPCAKDDAPFSSQVIHDLWCQTSILWPKSSSKCLLISQKGTRFKGFLDFFFCVCVSLSPCVCVCACTHAPTEAKRNTDTLELELQAFLSCPMWLLGSRLWSSDRAISVLDHWAIISSPRAFAFKICAPVNIRMFLPSPIGAFLKCKINQGYLNTSCLNTKAQLSSKYLKK